MHEQKIKPDIPYCQQISINDLYTFLAAIVQMGHDHKPNMEIYWTTALPHSFLLQCDAMRSSSHGSELSAFCRQSEPTNRRQRRSQVWQIMGSQVNIWHSEFKIFRTVSSNRWSNGEIQRESHLLAVTFQTRKNRFGIKVYTLCDRSGYTYGMRVYLGKQE
jgi:hypothetical protein